MRNRKDVKRKSIPPNIVTELRHLQIITDIKVLLKEFTTFQGTQRDTFVLPVS